MIEKFENWWENNAKIQSLSSNKLSASEAWSACKQKILVKLEQENLSCRTDQIELIIEEIKKDF